MFCIFQVSCKYMIILSNLRNKERGKKKRHWDTDTQREEHVRMQGGEDGHIQGSLGGSLVKNLPAVQETWVQSLGLEDPWRKEWQPTSVFLLGKSHGERSLAGYSLWGRIESDTTEQ